MASDVSTWWTYSPAILQQAFRFAVSAGSLLELLAERRQFLTQRCHLGA